ncbi:MAG: glycine cleavage system protein GcvH [Firmicutes bacterium]|nr:glycine cleavage system protein GcvH [Bacillota bacterium]MBQ5961320.1 glycine cleavage system protein GcvH [Bacillota bacterium]
MTFPKNLKYTETHEWVEEIGDGRVRVGITDYAQDQLGDLVYVTMPEEGDEVTEGQSFAEVESVKAVSEVNSPVTGTIAVVNEELAETPEAINDTPYEAWFVELSDVEMPDNLMDADEYQDFVEAEA